MDLKTKRYFIRLAYNGTRFRGWQRQPEGGTIQQTIEDGLSLILRQAIEITGCGRTDAGVHASDYFAHFDFGGKFPKQFVARLNKYLGKDILIKGIFEMHDEAHTRFDAQERSYEYHLIFEKNPFRQEVATHYRNAHQPDFEKMQEAAALLSGYDAFAPFCKTHSDAKTMNCIMMRSEWEKISDSHWVYHVKANRFLRGMVRLIVGACINVGIGKLDIETLRSAMERQTPLKQALSAPSEGLFLSEIIYPYAITNAIS